MIKRLSTFITTGKEFVYRHAPLRLICYVGITAALLLFWLWSGGDEISFVYNAF